MKIALYIPILLVNQAYSVEFPNHENIYFLLND